MRIFAICMIIVFSIITLLLTIAESSYRGSSEKKMTRIMAIITTIPIIFGALYLTGV